MPKGIENYPQYQSFIDIVRAVEKLPYFQRRIFLHKTTASTYPHFLYRYVGFNSEDAKSITYVEDIIVRSSLWLSSPNDFNDPFDTKAHVIIQGSPIKIREKLTGISKRTEQRKLSWRERNKLINEIMANPDKLLQNIRTAASQNFESLGICSFTTKAKNLLM